MSPFAQSGRSIARQPARSKRFRRLQLALVLAAALLSQAFASGASAAGLIDQFKLALLNACPWCDLRGVDFSGSNLADADLNNAVLAGARLAGADLRGARLDGADLGGADLRGAILVGANLRDANLRNANLGRAKLTRADLRMADLDGAILEGAVLREADLRGTAVPLASLEEADVTDAKLDAMSLASEQAIPTSDAPTEPTSEVPAVAARPANVDAGQILPSGLTVELVDHVRLPASSDKPPLARVNFLTHAGDGSKRLFVSDMNGKIYVIRDGRLLAMPFLDLAALREPYFDVGAFERGIASFAFHPDFAREGRPGYGKLYTAHTEKGSPASSDPAPRVFDSPTAEAHHHDLVIEWRVDPINPDRVDPTSSRELLRIGQPYKDHNIGQLAFNPNARQDDEDYGLLYIAVGDGGNTVFRGDVAQLRMGQDRTQPFGKILRIDPLQNGIASYRVPPGNPFVGVTGVLPEIWALGLRNPQRFSWDRGGAGRMFIIDIGQANIEEVNLGAAGANYGWSLREGTFVVVHSDEEQRLPLPSDDSALGITYPIVQYGHEEGFAIAGGFVYRGREIPAL